MREHSSFSLRRSCTIPVHCHSVKCTKPKISSPQSIQMSHCSSNSTAHPATETNKTQSHDSPTDGQHEKRELHLDGAIIIWQQFISTRSRHAEFRHKHQICSECSDIHTFVSSSAKFAWPKKHQQNGLCCFIPNPSLLITTRQTFLHLKQKSKCHEISLFSI